MNKKGQVGVGMIVLVAITLIVGAIFLQVIAQQVGESTTTDIVTNLSLGTQTNGTTYYIDGYRAISGVVIWGNGTTAPVTLTSGNYTVTNNVVNPTTGALAISILPASEYTATVWVLNATSVQDSTYIAESGARSVAGIIIIFFALAVAVVAISPVARSGVLEMIGK